MPERVFISSRIEELRHERATAYRSIFEKGLLPLMFEVEPIEDLKKTIDHMVDNADYFLAIYFHTVGSPNFNLMSLTPIEYELCRFIGKECSFIGKTCPEYKCFPKLRRLLTGHYTLPPESPNKKNDVEIKDCDDENEIGKCVEVVKKCADKIFIYHKYPFDEKSLSPELLALGFGLQRMKIGHTDFRTRWDLAKQIHDDKKLAPKNNFSIDLKKQACISYKGEDKPGQIAQLTAFALGISLNVERLILEVNEKYVTDIKAWFSSWEKDKNRDKDLPLVEFIKNEIKFARDLDKIRKNFRDTNQLHDSKVDKKEKPDSMTDPVFICHSTRSLHLFDVPPKNNPSKGLPIKVSIRSSRKKPFNIPVLKEYQILVKVVHLNCPGVLNRITKLLSGGMKERWEYILNIKWCLMERGTRKVLFGRTGAKDVREVEYSSTFDEYRNYRDDLLQTTQMVLELPGKRIRLENHELHLLHSALNSIIGVEQVRICRPPKPEDQSKV